MIKKLLQAAAVVFLMLAFAVAVFSNEALGPGGEFYYGKVLLGFLISYPLVAAVIVWEHHSSRNLKYWSAGVGIIATLVFVYSVGFTEFNIADPDKFDEQLLLLMYLFAFVSSLTTCAVRILKILWRLLHATVVKVNSLSRSLGLLRR
jgi:biotin transporter BioY